MLHPPARLGETRVAPLLAFGSLTVALPLALDITAKAVLLQPGRPLLGPIAAIGINVAAGVARVGDVVEMPTVLRAGRVGLSLADELVFLVDVYRQAVA